MCRVGWLGGLGIGCWVGWVGGWIGWLCWVVMGRVLRLGVEYRVVRLVGLCKSFSCFLNVFVVFCLSFFFF